VHDLTTDADFSSLLNRHEKAPDLKEAIEVAWKSSPVADVATWRSPVLLIHGDDDRNVKVAQTVDLAQRLRAQGAKFEEMVIPDEIHDFLRFATWAKVGKAITGYLEAHLK